MTTAPKNWDIIYLGCSENIYADSAGKVSTVSSDRFNFNLCPSNILEALESPQIKKITSDRCIAGTWAFILNSRSAQKLLTILRSQKIDRPIDNQLSGLVGSKQINAYCASPPIVTPNQQLESTIR